MGGRSSLSSGLGFFTDKRRPRARRASLDAPDSRERSPVVASGQPTISSPKVNKSHLANLLLRLRPRICLNEGGFRHPVIPRKTGQCRL